MNTSSQLHNIRFYAQLLHVSATSALSSPGYTEL